jgi:hypothetical protein
MRKLLIVCDLGHCPHRIPGWANELSNLGWKVIVLSPQMTKRQQSYLGIKTPLSWVIDDKHNFPMVYRRYFWLSSKFQSIYSRFHDLRYRRRSKRAANLIVEEFGFKEYSRVIANLSHLAWYEAALNRALQIINKEKIDLILSSSSPFTAHLIARAISIKTGINWIADYRDPWSLNHTKKVFDELEIEIESRLLDDCSGCLTATDGMADLLSKIFSGQIETIHNAFKDSLKTPKKFPLNGTLNIVYTGTIYEGYQDSSVILEALESLNENSEKFVLEVYGFASAHFEKFYKAKSHQIPKYVHLYSHKSVSEIHQIQEKADLLLFLDWKEDIGWESTKLIEYLAQPGLIIGTGYWADGRASSIINCSGRGKYFTNSQNLIDFLDDIFSKGSNFEGIPRQNQDYTSQFSFAHQVMKFIDFIVKIS